MIGLLAMLFCMYRFIFTDWTLTTDQQVMFVLAVLIEITVEVLIGFGIDRVIKEVNP